MKVHQTICTAILSVGLGVLSISHAQSLSALETKTEQMLTAIGGRAAWAAVLNTVNDSQQNRLESPTVVRAVITMDFTRPRFRIDTTAPDIRIARVIDGDRNWRLTRKGAIDDVPGDIVKEDLTWYAGHVYRTLHRIAVRDPLLRLADGKSERIEVYESDKRIAWFALDARGEPYAFGAHADDTGSICGPWDFVQSGIRHPTWVARPDGTRRASIKSLAVNVPLADDLFVRPKSSQP